MAAPSLVLFRRDLRVADHPALAAAMDAGPTVAVYVLDDSADGRPLGGAARWWLQHALTRLAADLQRLGVPLILRRGAQNVVIPALAREVQAGGLYWSRRYTPWGVAADTDLKAWANETGIPAQSYAGSYLVEPWAVQTKQGQPFKVFTPFYKVVLAAGEPSPPLSEPPPQEPLLLSAESDTLTDWSLLPTQPDWASGLRQTWQVTAGKRAADFLDSSVNAYPDARDRPDIDGTSMLSPFLAFGEISPRQLWHAARHRASLEPTAGAGAFLRQLVWRDFCSSLLYHFPHIANRPFQQKFEGFPWADDPTALRAWQQGRTGYPWIDAGMQQLWHTGWMHNRVRMGVASFLTKHLLLPWQAGEAWFWGTLVDADPAQNIANWQWVAGCGADAAPYFRIFNPITQGGKFDPDGAYRRRWLPKAMSYDPGAAGTRPIVEHRFARERALTAYAVTKGA